MSVTPVQGGARGPRPAAGTGRRTRPPAPVASPHGVAAADAVRRQQPCARRGQTTTTTRQTRADEEAENRGAVGRRAAGRAGRGRVPVGLDGRPRVVQQGAVGAENAFGQHGVPAGVQGDRQEARNRRLVRAQVFAQGAGHPVLGPAPERGADPPDIRHPVHRARVHGLLRSRRPAQSLATRQEHTALAGAHVFQVSPVGT